MAKTDFKALLKKKQQAEEKLNQAKKEFHASAKEVFKDWSKDLFVRYPALENITWTQYTPYFNDGEPCYFRSSHDCYSVNTDECEEFNDEGFTKEERENLEKEINEFMSNFDDDDMESLFGDHCMVSITKHGVDVEEYHHD